MIKDLHLMMVKTVAMEAFPEKGWFGFVTMTEGKPHFWGIFSREDLYQEVMKLIYTFGPNIRTIAQCITIKKGNKTVFVPYTDAKTADDAARIVCQKLPSL